MVDRSHEQTDHTADVVIVSAFGRGDWLATELATRGWKVTLVDVSDQMGEWPAEDAEGPFGFLESAGSIPSQKTRIAAEGEVEDVGQGLVIWLPRGPLEFKSELTTFMLDRHRVNPTVEGYLRIPGAPNRESERERRRILDQSFEDGWLAHFAHQVASTEYVENHRALEHGEPLPLFAPLSVRHTSANGRAKSLKVCQAAGVKIRPHARIHDVRKTDSHFDAVEVADEHAGVERGRIFLWMLSSAETARCPKHVGEKIYGSILQPEWFWARYRMEIGSPIDRELPKWLAIVKDPLLPWTHSNLIIMRRFTEAGRVAVWLRLPVWARFDRAYLEKVGEEARALIEAKLPGAHPKISQWPIDHERGEAKLGPPRFPVYAEGALDKRRDTSGKNLFLDSPELWKSLDWFGMFKHQNAILSRLEKIKAQWEAAERKQAARSSRSPSP